MSTTRSPAITDRRCPKCFKFRPEGYFEYPVSMCLVCYSACPGNEGLRAEALRLKAHKSRTARKRIARIDPDVREQFIFNSTPPDVEGDSGFEDFVQERQQGKPLTDLAGMDEEDDVHQIPCDVCHKWFVIDVIVSDKKIEGKAVLICKSCAGSVKLT